MDKGWGTRAHELIPQKPARELSPGEDDPWDVVAIIRGLIALIKRLWR